MHPIFAAGTMAASLVVGAPHAMTPDGVFDSFRRYCVANQAASSPAINQAEANGWRLAPDAAVGWFHLPEMQNLAVRARVDGHVVRIIAVGGRALNAGGAAYQVATCVAAARPVDADAIAAAVAAWVGVRPVQSASRAGVVAYDYVEDAAGRRNLADLDPEQAKAMLTAGAVRYLFVITSGDRVAIALSVPRL